MPYIGNQCPDPAMPEVVDARKCLECSLTRPERRCHYPSFLLADIVAEKVTTDGKEPKRYSPTVLSTCLRAVALRQQYDYTINPMNYWVMARGKVFHSFVEGQPQVTGIVRENRLKVPVKLSPKLTIDFEGQPDEVMAVHRHLVDYKSVKYISSYMTDPMNLNQKWIAQLSCYRWMLHKLGTEIETAEIQLLDMNSLHRMPYRLWSLEETERYIRTQLAKLYEVYEHQIIEPVLPEDEQWMCERCEVRTACENVALERDEMPPTPEDRKKRR